MYIHNLYLQNFKIFPDAHLSFRHRRALISGSNGFGKTTLLEAIHTFLTSYSFSKQKDKELLSYNTSQYNLLGELESQDQHHSLFLKYDSSRQKKQFSLDGKNISRYKSLLEKFPLVSFTPLDIQNILGEPSFRRSFFDRMFSYLNPQYYIALSTYRRVLKERNQILKLKDYSLLEMWDEKFLDASSFLLDRRKYYLSQFNQLHGGMALEIPEFLNGVRWEYKGPEDRKELQLLLEKKSQQEKLLQTTLLGPHRDDYLFIGRNQQEIRKYFSLGQIKWATFYMKFLEILLMNKTLSSNPLFLIDDVFSELDKSNRQIIFPLLESLPNQILATVTDFEWVSGYLKESFDIFSLKTPGKISEGIF